MHPAIIFDIETGPLPEAELQQFMPEFESPSNYKDPAKIEAYLAEKRKAWAGEAALSALTGRVIAIGIIQDGEALILDNEDESKLIDSFWGRITHPIDPGAIRTIAGFNCNLFDLPFLVRRSWKHNVFIPIGLRDGRYWSKDVIDLRDIWQLGDRQSHGSLDSIARHLGVGRKTGNGADFARLWQENRQQAIAYLTNDLMLTAKVASRLGVII